MKKIFLILSLALLTNSAEAKDYQWKVLQVVDGDTIKVEIPGLEEMHTSVRVLGVDTPEKFPRAKCMDEDNLGHDATAYTKSLIEKGKVIIFTDIKWDKYGGRILAHVKIDGKDLSEQLISANLARSYHGEKKKGWCK